MPKHWLKNTKSNYGTVFIAIHWLMAITIISLFILGLWMVELDYYSEWYQTGPFIHKSIGITVAIFLMIRFVIRISGDMPLPEQGAKILETKLAGLVHALLYLIIVGIVCSGYMISTADGRPIEVFGLIEIPATVVSFENQEDVFGNIHLLAAYTLMSLVALHALASIKHHIIDKDNTLTRMLGISKE
jgi:cytochrome b561